MQLIRKARLGCDAIFPGGSASTLWADDELVDLVDDANETLELHLRLKMKKWGVQTLTAASSAFTREGETYNPATSLVTTSGQTTLSLPPDLGEIVRIMCTSDTTVRFAPAQFESPYWIELEQGFRNLDGTFPAGTSSQGFTYHYDVIAERTLAITPPLVSGLSLSIDYTPMKRPLYYTNAGTVTIATSSTDIIGTGTMFQTDGVFAAESGQRAEIIIGVNTLASTSIRLDRDYPTVAAIAGDAEATLQSASASTVTDQPFIIAMVPMAPRVYHRWIARLTAVYMLSKVNPDLSDKYAKQVMEKLATTVSPTANRRQIQESPVTDAESLFGGLSDF